MTVHAFKLPKNAIETLQAINRLQAVEATGLTDGSSPEAFDRICSTVGTVFNAPVAQITMLEEERQCINNSIGFDIKEAPTSTSFCAQTISAESDVTIIQDTYQDVVYKTNPFVVNPPHVRFYAGCPIRFEGEKVGTLCVYDFHPRDIVTEEQINFMQQLARDAEAAIYGETEKRLSA